MPLDIAAKLAACRNYTDAKPILEMFNASGSSHELMQLYFAQPENSPYRTRFISTVTQEIENDIDPEKHKGGPHDQGKIGEQENNNGEKNGEKGTQEYEITGSKTSTSSSSEAPAMEGDNKPPTVGDSSVQPTENQMKEQMPGMPGMMPPQMGVPGVPPELQHAMEQSMAKMPPMNPMQQMKYTQEMVKGFVTPLYVDLKGIKEAIAKLDTKIQETQVKSVPLSIPGGEKLVYPSNVRETVFPSPNPGGIMGTGAQPTPSTRDVNDIRQKIVEQDAIITATKQNKDTGHIYQ